MVCRWAYGFAIIINLIFVNFFDFELSNNRLSIFYALHTVRES